MKGLNDLFRNEPQLQPRATVDISAHIQKGLGEMAREIVDIVGDLHEPWVSIHRDHVRLGAKELDYKSFSPNPPESPYGNWVYVKRGRIGSCLRADYGVFMSNMVYEIKLNDREKLCEMLIQKLNGAGGHWKRIDPEAQEACKNSIDDNPIMINELDYRKGMVERARKQAQEKYRCAIELLSEKYKVNDDVAQWAEIILREPKLPDDIWFDQRGFHYEASSGARVEVVFNKEGYPDLGSIDEANALGMALNYLLSNKYDISWASDNGYDGYLGHLKKAPSQKSW